MAKVLSAETVRRYKVGDKVVREVVLGVDAAVGTTQTARRIVVLGGTGHVGSYLCPLLASDPNNNVICISRGQSKPYPALSATFHADNWWDRRTLGPSIQRQLHRHQKTSNTDTTFLEQYASEGWGRVQHITLDRGTTAKEDFNFVGAVVALDPHVVIDLICFTHDSCARLIKGLKRSCTNMGHFVHLGSIWIYGPSATVPTYEDDVVEEPLCEYGRGKLDIQRYLLTEATLGRCSFHISILHPGHIVGVGWCPLNPEGHFDPAVFLNMRDLAVPVQLPHRGLATLHHVHAIDVANAVIAILDQPEKASGEAFHIVSPQALTMRGYALQISRRLFGHAPLMQFPSTWSEFAHEVGPDKAAMSKDHVDHSPHCSVDKLKEKLGFVPAYSSLDAIEECVQWLLEQDHGKLIERIKYPGKQTVIPNKEYADALSTLLGKMKEELPSSPTHRTPWKKTAGAEHII